MHSNMALEPATGAAKKPEEACTHYTGKVLGERYEIREQIGYGQYAIVYIVHDSKAEKLSERKKATKIIPYDALSKDVVTEAKILMDIQHPNIVKLHDAIYVENKLFMITDYCDGHDLGWRISRERKAKNKLTESTVLRWIFQLLQGLQFIHSKNIVHRDINPRNILLHEDNVKVGDFGVSRVLLETSDRADTLVGNSAYMSPEVVNSEGYVQKSDIWSVGCVLYELVALKRAFSAKNIVDLFRQISYGELPEWPKDYSKELRRILNKALTKDPESRPTAKDMLRMRAIKRHTDANGEFSYNKITSLEMTQDHPIFTSQEDLLDCDSQSSYVDTDQTFVYPAVMTSIESRGATANDTEVHTSYISKAEVDVDHAYVYSSPHKGKSMSTKLSWTTDVDVPTSFGATPPIPVKSQSLPKFPSEDSADSAVRPLTEHVVNFVVRQKESDMECIYIDCVLKGNVQSRLRELEDLGFNRGPMKSKDIVIQDNCLIRVTTTGAIGLSVDGTDCSCFDMSFDAELDSAGEEGWVVPLPGDASDVFKYKGFVTFSVPSTTLCSRERHRSSSAISDTVDVVLCALPLSIKTIEHQLHEQTIVRTQASSQISLKSQDFWNPIVAIVQSLRGDDWVKLGRQLEYETSNLNRFHDEDTTDGSSALANLLMDYFRRRRDSDDTISKLSEALQTLGYKDTANVLIQKDQSAEEEWKFKKVVHELSEDAVLLRDHKHFLRMLGLSEADVESILFNRTLPLKEIVRTGVFLWRSQNSSDGAIEKIVTCLGDIGHKRLAESITEQFVE